jgi:two-component system phosphate regulon sensor histidine kinase PhoR
LAEAIALLVAMCCGAAIAVLLMRVVRSDTGRPIGAARVDASPERDQHSSASDALPRASDAAAWEAGTDGLVVISPELRITRSNGAAREMLGRELEGRSLVEATVSLEIEAAAREHLAAGAPMELEIGLERDRRLAVRLQRLGTEGSLMVLRDISELVRLRRIRTEFVENLSHELRTPVTAIGLLAELLAAETAAPGSVPAKVRERIMQLESDTVHLGQMISELLDLARIESGEGMRMEDKVDLAAISRSVLDRLRPYAAQAGVALRLDGVQSMPIDRPGNAARLAQVVTNLVHNAIKFSASGSSVEAHLAVEGGDALLRVVDHGAGIARADLDRVFERFFVADRARSKGGGTGLGLAIARHIAEAHGGRITVASQLGEGSTFTLALPLR